MLKLSKRHGVSLLCLLMGYQLVAKAEESQFIKDSTIDGNLRFYDFARNFDGNTPNQNAISLGGALNILTGQLLPGLRLGATFYTAQGLGLNSGNIYHVDNTLPGYNVTALGQAFVQYQYQQFSIKAGDQLLDTPWMNSLDFRMIPPTYQGFSGSYSITSAMQFNALRMFSFKSRTDDGYSETNLYNTTNPAGTGGTAYPAFGGTSNDGALAFGLTGKDEIIKAQAWAYQFFDFAKLLYADTTYRFTEYPIGSAIPYLGAQGLYERGDGNNILASYSGGNAHASALGVKGGVEVENFDVSLAYDNIPTESNSFKSGDVLSPYTSGYSSDPLYTTSMIAGLVEKSAGYAYKLTGTYSMLDKQLQFAGSHARYYTEPRYSDTDETDFDVNYHLTGNFKGLSARYRLGLMNGFPSPVGGAPERFVYHRILFEYKF